MNERGLGIILRGGDSLSCDCYELVRIPRATGYSPNLITAFRGLWDNNSRRCLCVLFGCLIEFALCASCN